MEKVSNFKQFLFCIKYDFKIGILKRFYWYVIEIILLIVIAADEGIKLRNDVAKPDFADILSAVFLGELPYDAASGEVFEPPFLYMFIFMFFAFSACYYAAMELKRVGSLHIVRCNNKWIWWLSKSVWNAVNTIVLYSGVFFAVWIAAGAVGSRSIQTDKMTQAGNAGSVMVYVFVLGAFVVLALNQLQLLIQLILSPVISMICMLAVLIISAFAYSPWLLGNYLMLIRSSDCMKNGADIGMGIGFSLVVWLTAVFIGMVIIKKKDII